MEKPSPVGLQLQIGGPVPPVQAKLAFLQRFYVLRQLVRRPHESFDALHSHGGEERISTIYIGVPLFKHEQKCIGGDSSPRKAL